MTAKKEKAAKETRVEILGLVSLILGILGILTLPFVFLPGMVIIIGILGLASLITGTLATQRIKDKSKAKRGRGIAVAGTALGLTLIVVPCLLLAVGFFAPGRIDGLRLFVNGLIGY